MARILLAKLGTDAHDNGITIVAEWLRRDGHEVTYSGLYVTPEQVAEQARETAADVVGISYLASEPVYLTARLLERLAEKGLADTPVVVGGVVTPLSTARLRELGIEGIFPPGSRRQAILDGVAAALAGEGRNIPR
jgi:methylmalonyl-CoA mutase C-terminal domain/subunit